MCCLKILSCMNHCTFFNNVQRSNCIFRGKGGKAVWVTPRELRPREQDLQETNQCATILMVLGSGGSFFPFTSVFSHFSFFQSSHKGRRM